MFAHSCSVSFLILSAPFVDFTSIPAPPPPTTYAAPTSTSIPVVTPTPGLSREEVEKIVEGMYGARFQQVPNHLHSELLRYVQ